MSGPRCVIRPFGLDVVASGFGNVIVRQPWGEATPASNRSKSCRLHAIGDGENELQPHATPGRRGLSSAGLEARAPHLVAAAYADGAWSR
jgi:hypothetical protein